MNLARNSKFPFVLKTRTLKRRRRRKKSKVEGAINIEAVCDKFATREVIGSREREREKDGISFEKFSDFQDRRLLLMADGLEDWRHGSHTHTHTHGCVKHGSTLA